MNTKIDLSGLVTTLGPQIAEGAAERDAAGAFASDNYKLLKQQCLDPKLARICFSTIGRYYQRVGQELVGSQRKEPKGR